MIEPALLLPIQEPPWWAPSLSFDGPGWWCVLAGAGVLSCAAARRGLIALVLAVVASTALACAASAWWWRDAPTYQLLGGYQMEGPERHWKNPLLTPLESNGTAAPQRVAVGAVSYRLESPIVGDILGPFVSSNQFAMMIGLSWPAVVACWTALGRRAGAFRHRAASIFLVGGALLLAVAGLALQARAAGSWAGVASSTLAVAMTIALAGEPGSPMRRRALVAAVITLVVLIALLGGIVAIDQSGESGAQPIENLQRSFSHRWTAWGFAWDAWLQRPVTGIGLGNYRWAQPSDASTIYLFAHNDYLQLLSETGLVGVALLASAVACAAYYARENWAEARVAPDRVWRLAAACGLFHGAFHSFFDYSLRAPLNGLVFATLAGAFLGFRRLKRKRSAELLLVSGAGGLLLVGVIWLSDDARDDAQRRNLSAASLRCRVASGADERAIAAASLRVQLDTAEAYWRNRAVSVEDALPVAIAYLRQSGGFASPELERAAEWFARVVDAYPHQASVLALASIRRVLREPQTSQGRTMRNAAGPLSPTPPGPNRTVAPQGVRQIHDTGGDSNRDQP